MNEGEEGARGGARQVEKKAEAGKSGLRWSAWWRPQSGEAAHDMWCLLIGYRWRIAVALLVLVLIGSLLPDIDRGTSAIAFLLGGVAAVMLLAGDAVWRGRMTVGDLVLVNAYVLQVCLPLNALGFIYRETRPRAAAAERYQPAHRAGPHVGGGRQQRFRQVDAGAPAAALLRSHRRPHPSADADYRRSHVRA